MNQIIDTAHDGSQKLTPMMEQYFEIKRQNEGYLLFYRMGDFYEMFFDDAIKASAALDIALTKRNREKGQDIPMCGVPVHSHEIYLSRLIKKGFKVAICEQMEDPAQARKERGSGTLVKREGIRLIDRRQHFGTPFLQFPFVFDADGRRHRHGMGRRVNRRFCRADSAGQNARSLVRRHFPAGTQGNHRFRQNPASPRIF